VDFLSREVPAPQEDVSTSCAQPASPPGLGVAAPFPSARRLLTQKTTNLPLKQLRQLWLWRIFKGCLEGEWTEEEVKRRRRQLLTLKRK